MAILKDVCPKGLLLSETDTGVDYLGGSVYAEAIAQSIHHARTSITFGIFAKWGSGKSFLLRHTESMLKRLQNQNDTAEETKGLGSTKRLLAWIIALSSIFATIGITLLLAIDPSILMPSPMESQKLEMQTIYPGNPTIVNDPITVPEVKNGTKILWDLKIVGLVFIPIELIAIFAVGFWGRTWLSRKYYGRFSILIYGAFTKLPIISAQSEIVEDPGQSPADELRFASLGDERFIDEKCSSEKETLPRKYIFVNFKAWEYAGSDTLWAAIVTNISDAIEAEFGVITTRLFRILDIVEAPRNALEKNDRKLYLKFKHSSREEDILNMMRQYGVVKSLEQTDVKDDDGLLWWGISYSTKGEFRNAKYSLKIEGVHFETNNPTIPESPKSKPNARQPLIPNCIPMGTIGRSKCVSLSDDEYCTKTVTENKCCCGCCAPFCSHFYRHPIKVWKLPRLFWWILLATCVLLMPVVGYIVADNLDLEVHESIRIIPIPAQILMWLPGSAAVAFAVCQFAWAMCHSQRQRINQALDGTKGRMANELGFMNKVKTEIMVMTNLIRCARFINQTDYKVIITIDDLDQVELKQVHSVLEAVSILLSDKSSPFFCLIAADPRIVVKCVEESLGKAMSNAKVTGREYIKKIVNLPVCLPEISDPNKRRYVAGLIDQSDGTVTYRDDECGADYKKTNHRQAAQSRGKGDVVDAVVGANRVVSLQNTELDHETFLFECRKFLYGNKDLHRYLVGNARNIKRIFNIVSLTACVINCLIKKRERRKFMRTNVKGHCQQAPIPGGIENIVRNKEMAEDIVLWIVLVDHWPYRASYIIQVLEDANQRVESGFKGQGIPEGWTIWDIFKNKVEGKFENPDESLITLDADPDLFQGYLSLLNKRGFNKERINSLFKLTINLDYSIRRTIAFSLNPPRMSELEGGYKTQLGEAAKTSIGQDPLPQRSVSQGRSSLFHPKQTSTLAFPETVC